MKLQSNLYTVLSACRQTGVCTIHLIENCMIYQAHFPGNPITPGACIIQIAQELYEQLWGHSVEILEVKNAKFLKTITPSPDNRYHYSFSQISADSDNDRMQVVVSDDDSSTSEAAEPISIYAKFSLVCKSR